MKQAGSRVAPDRLRFDFTHFSQVDVAQLDEIEMRVNQRICENMPTRVQEMDAEEAFKTNAMALFEEKYGDRVRVVSLGEFSKELCGGTHTAMTGNIGLFKIVSEASVASGVRRIEAFTGMAAVAHVQKISRIVNQGAHILREQPDQLCARIEKTLAAQKILEKEIEAFKAKLASQSAEASENDLRTVNGVKVFAKQVTADSPAALRDLADQVKDRISSGIVVLGSVSGKKVLLVVGVTKDLTSRYHAGKLIKRIAGVVGGGGGGRPDMAQAGGTKPELIGRAIAEGYAAVGDM